MVLHLFILSKVKVKPPITAQINNCGHDLEFMQGEESILRVVEIEVIRIAKEIVIVSLELNLL